MERLDDVLRRLGVGRLVPTIVEPEEEGPPPCPICHGAGFICYDVPRDHADFGRAVPCKCRSEELTVARRSRLERISNLGPLTRLTFDNLIADGRNPETADHRNRFRFAVTTAKSFAANPEGWLILVGPPGCGKTHLGAAIANARIGMGETTFFAVVPDLLDHLRGAYSPSSEVTYDDLFENVRSASLLVLDDLGTQSSTPWAMEKLYQLFNFRYNNRLPTVVTTNHSLEDVDERLRVRLTDPDFTQICYLQPPQSAAFQRLGGTLDLLRHMTFESFAPEGRELRPEQSESLRAAFEAAALFAANPEGWLVFHGGYGCGKTHLAAAIANSRLAENRSGTFVSVPDLLDHLRSTYGPDSPVTYDQLFEEIRSTQLLILDDLGTQSATAWAEEKLYQLFNFRYNARLPTVITTNLNIDDLEPRVASRLSDPGLLYGEQIFEIVAPDYRRPDAPQRRPTPAGHASRRTEAGAELVPGNRGERSQPALTPSPIIEWPNLVEEAALRIGIDARLADYTLGGIARYTTQLVTALRRLGSEHDVVAVRARRPKVAPPELPVTEAIRVQTPPHHRLERFTLPWELRGAHLDVLHSPDFISPRPAAWRSVITVHDLAYLRMPWLVTGASRRYYGGIHRAVQETDAVIAVSQATSRDLVELAGAPAEKVSVVYEAAEAELTPMPKDEAAAVVEERHGVVGPYILFVGTLEPRKNLPVLLQAFASLRREFPVRLVIAGGTGWLSDDVFRTVKSLALEDGVVFLGDVRPADLRPLYCAARVLVLPSLYEGFGLPPLEAMACGTPVVVSNAGSLPEIVGDAGVQVRPDDPEDIANGLGWVLGNERYQEILIERGRARAATFSWDRAARETMAVYERVAAG